MLRLSESLTRSRRSTDSSSIVIWKRKPPVPAAAKYPRERSIQMSRATPQYHNLDPAEQPSLLSQEELRDMQCLSASRPRKGEIASRKARRQDIGERLIQRAGATQLKLPGI